MVSRLPSLYFNFPDPLTDELDVKLYFPLPGQPQASRCQLQAQLFIAHTKLRSMSEEKTRWRTSWAHQHAELQQKDAQLQQLQQQLALQQQQLDNQYLVAAKLRKQCKEQQMQLGELEQELAARPTQQKKPEQDACSKVTIAPAAEAASPRAGCGLRGSTPRALTSAADGARHGKSFLASADSVKEPEAPTPVDSRATYSPRSSSSSSSSSDDGCSSSVGSMAKEQTACADSSWWWWSPSNTSTTSSTATCSTTTTSSSNEGTSSLFSSWWVVEQAVDMAVGAAGDILYL